MAVPRGFFDYIKAAFSAKPAGMFVAPNWVGLAAFGLLGVLNPGWWLIGAGVEAAYLLTLASSARFRKVIDAEARAAQAGGFSEKLDAALRSLAPSDRGRYTHLTTTCRAILSSNNGEGHADTLANLSWLFLSLLQTRQALRRLVSSAAEEEAREGSLTERLEGVDAQLADPAVSPELRRSLESRRDLLNQRLQNLRESEGRLAHAEAELLRIEEQAGLLRDQSMVRREPAALSRDIDRISSELAGTSRWMSEQRELLGELDSLGESPPAAAVFQTES